MPVAGVSRLRVIHGRARGRCGPRYAALSEHPSCGRTSRPAVRAGRATIVSSRYAPHLDADPLEVSEDRRALALDQSEVDQGPARLGWGSALPVRPEELAAGLGPRHPERPLRKRWTTKSKRRGNAPHLVHRDGREIRDAVAGLLEELAPRRVLHALVWLDAPAGEATRPRTGRQAVSR